MKTRRPWIIGLCAALVGIAAIVWAGSPHFIASKTKLSINSDGALVVKFKEAGLGVSAVSYSFIGTASVTCNCVTSNGNCPQASNKVTSTVQVSDTGTFIPKNGTVSATLILDAPGCGSSAPPTCGGGQHLVLSAIEWTGIVFEDITNNVTAFSDQSEGPLTFFVCP